MKRNTAVVLAALAVTASTPTAVVAQSAGWQNSVWREPQVRYLLADLTLGGNPGLYRKYATEEKDPDSREAIRACGTPAAGSSTPTSSSGSGSRTSTAGTAG
jgi:hypothetical protein